MTTNVPPYCTPEECDHEGPLPCSQCCPCAECGALRADDAARYEAIDNSPEAVAARRAMFTGFGWTR